MVRPAGWSGGGSSPPVLPSRKGVIIGRHKWVTFKITLTSDFIFRKNESENNDLGVQNTP